MAANTIGLASFAAAAASGLAGAFRPEGRLSGYGLLLHVAAAAGFGLAAIVIALFWCERNRFIGPEWRTSRHAALRKLFFWIALVLVFPTLVSILAAMFPLPTPAEQQWLFVVHRCCALALAASGSLFAWFALMTWRDRRG